MEEWRKIEWYLRYQVSNLWNIRSNKPSWCKILKSNPSAWYPAMSLSKNWIKKTLRVHNLVAVSFLWPKWDLVVNHKDWNKLNNKLDNLEYVTRSENCIHSFKILWHQSPNKWKFWRDNHRARKIIQKSLKNKFIKKWDSTIEAANFLWINPSQITNNIKWRNKSWGWYIWKSL